MSRTLSAAALSEAFAQNSGEVFLPLLTLSHPGMTTLRVVDDFQNLVSNGETYTAFPFKLSMPSDITDRLPVARLAISNVDRRIIDEIRTLTGAISVELVIVTASDPDTVEAGPFTFDLVSAKYDINSITGDLMSEPILNEPYPAGNFDPQSFPGLFGSV